MEHKETQGQSRSLASALARRVRGSVHFDDGTRALYAADASNYRQLPIGVVFPRDAQDVIAVHDVCREHGAPILGRGGGTSLAGQCCNEAVVMDFSRHMNAVLQIDPEARTARVQPGVVLDQLQQAAAKYGLVFGPDPATHSHCTLGGMVGNNSCGVHAVQSEFYGPGPRTEDNLVELEVLTYRGARLRLRRMEDGSGSAPDLVPDEPELGRQLRALRDRYADEIRRDIPRLLRRVSGYNLPALLPENGSDLAKAVCGSESTLATTLEITVKLIERLPHRVLVAIGYPSVYDAADHVLLVRRFRPIGCEGLDDVLRSYMRKKRLHVDNLDILPEGQAWLFVEFGGKTQEEAIDQARALTSALDAAAQTPSYRLVKDEALQEKLWEIRESGLGATAFVPGEPDAWPGWEDAGVPVVHLARYLRDFRDLLDRYSYKASLYGHFGQGCVHCRINFELTTENGIKKYLAFTDEAADLVVRLGGSLSGEHGDGQARGELLPKMFGPAIMQAFREFKAAWDPDGKMNPGKQVDAMPRDRNLRLGSEYRPWEPSTHFHYPEDDDKFSRAALRCVGVGKCRREGGGTMCPSYMVTRDEKHSTRGRAHLLFEMLKGEAITNGWRSEEVKDALHLCLECKGCKHDCPVNVDMATYKAEFNAHYYEGRLRPRSAYAFGLIYRWARIAALAPSLVNVLASTPGVRSLMKWAAGMAQDRDIPRFAKTTFRTFWKRRSGRGPSAGRRRVVLWPDTFNNHFHPYTLLASAQLLEEAGFDVVIPERALCCGRPLYGFGMLEQARALWRETLDTLGAEIDAGTPLVGVEPSCLASFRDELPALMADDPRAHKLSRQAFTLAEFLEEHAPDWKPPVLGQRALLQAHCHHKSIMGIDAEEKLMQASRLEFEIPEPGCCGMAGAFGFEHDKYEVSRAIAERELLPAVRQAQDSTLILADGFSCREQIRQGSERRALHLAEALVLGRALGREGEAVHRMQQFVRPEARLEVLRPRELTTAGPGRPLTVLVALLVVLFAASAMSILLLLRNGW